MIQPGICPSNIFFVWLLQNTEAADANKLSIETQLGGCLKYIQAACRENLHLSVTFTYSQRPVSFSELPNGFVQMKKGLGNLRSLAEDAVIFPFGEMPPENSSDNNSSMVIAGHKLLPQLTVLEGYFELGQQEEFFDLFTQIADPLRQVKSLNYGPALEVYYSLATLMMRLVNMYHLTEQAAFHIGLYKLLRLDLHENWQEAVNYLYELASILFQIRSSNVEHYGADAILFLQKYIEKNISGDLTLVTLSDIANLNPSYLSRLFKEKTGKNLYEYIVEIRIGQSQELLRNPAERIQDVAKKVGYDSAQSFTRAFRHLTGMTPSEFRSKNL